jgi:hypothetical protein
MMAKVEPRNYCESSIIVDLRFNFDEISEMQGVCGKLKSSKRSSPEEITLSGIQIKCNRRTRTRGKDRGL